MSQTQATTATLLVPGVWDIDPAHSNVEFVVRHLLSRVRGRFTAFAGAIEIGEDPTRSSAQVTIEAASVATNLEQRDDHLRGPDFLDVERFPELTYRSFAVREFDGQSLRLDGELTVRDVTRPVSLAVDFLGTALDPWGGTRAAFSARTQLDRDEFGATGNVVLETGGVLIGKQVQVELEIQAVLRAS